MLRAISTTVAVRSMRSDLFGRHMAQYTRSDGCPRTEPLSLVSALFHNVSEGIRTVNVDIALLHELAELREPLGSVDLGHVDSAECSSDVQSSSSGERVFDGYIGRRCRVCAP